MNRAVGKRLATVGIAVGVVSLLTIIVGFVMPASASALVNAWAASPSHNAWMLRSDKTSMQIGAAVLNNRLYGAVNFS